VAARLQKQRKLESKNEAVKVQEVKFLTEDFKGNPESRISRELFSFSDRNPGLKLI